jgi:hypothetical protein
VVYRRIWNFDNRRAIYNGGSGIWNELSYYSRMAGPYRHESS